MRGGRRGLMMPGMRAIALALMLWAPDPGRGRKKK
jgi:hypothetical protein